MITAATQQTRHLAIHTPLGQDKLLLCKLEGREELSRLFNYKVEMLSADDEIDPAEILGQPVSIRISHENGRSRYLNGLVSEFCHMGRGDVATTYTATIVPWLWLLTQRTDCRIFQDQSTPEIVEEVLTTMGLTDFELKLMDSYQARSYCVQYCESDFNFVSRLMEEEGIYYYFVHDGDKETLIIADRPDNYYEIEPNEIEFATPEHTGHCLEQIKTWRHCFKYHSGAYAQQDFNFETPDTNLMSPQDSLNQLAGNSALEVYDFPGRHPDRAEGRKLSRVRIEEIESTHSIATGTSTVLDFSPGGRFKLKSHRSNSEQGRGYVLKAVEISATVEGTYIAGSTDSDTHFEYTNHFECLSDQVQFRPTRMARKPIVEGSQTARIVGPSGEEIYTDAHGRVKVQFHWDRYGAFDEYSSCWIRVSQQHAGKSWGGIDLPRIGEEVIVDFFEGDPDAPVVTGRVYNGANPPPFDLPAEKTRSGMKSQTHKGSGFNEISMDDTAGAEQMRVNAQHNMDTAVGNNASKIVNVDSDTSIGNNESTTVGNDSSESVGNNKEVKVGNNMTVDVGTSLSMTAGSSITLKCGASKLYMNAGGVITITGTLITTAAAANASVAAPMTQVIGGIMCNTVGAVNMMSGGICHVGAAGLASVAGGKVDLSATGVTSIQGSTITLN